MSTQLQKNWLYRSIGLLLIGVIGIIIIGIASLWSPSKNPTINTAKLIAYSEIPLNITVHRSPTCGCCKAWVQHLEANGFEATDIITEDVAKVKQQYRVPDELTSCHTAVIDGYAIEGHVPASDIKRLLAEKPQISGLAVPQMPIGSPGMESGNIKEPFSVLSFHPDGRVKTFNQY